jgi:hypothetical protein
VLTEFYLASLKRLDRSYAVWDLKQKGLAVLVQKSGHMAWKCVYSIRGRGSRWYHIGDTRAVGLADARKIAAKVMLEVILGKDPMAERVAQRGSATFEELHHRYVDEHAKKKNKSWKQADRLVRKHLLPRWAKLRATDITRADVKAMLAHITAPVTANQTLAAASAIFSWAAAEEAGGVTVNPCTRVVRNETRDRERILSEVELPRFWTAFDSLGLVAASALRVVLLTGQRPGEVSHMRREHVAAGWWTLPGLPDDELGWPGTKNGATHSVWLPAAAQKLIAELGAVTQGSSLQASAAERSRTWIGLCAEYAQTSKSIAPRHTTCEEPTAPPSPASASVAMR